MGRNKRFENMTPEEIEKWENRTAPLQRFRLYTLTDIEPIVGATHRTLLDHVKTGKLKAVKLGGVWQVSEENIRAFVNGETVPQPSQYSTRFDELYSLWENETEDPDTQEWREDLSPFEEKTVDTWDNNFTIGAARMAADTLKAAELRAKIREDNGVSLPGVPLDKIVNATIGDLREPVPTRAAAVPPVIFGMSTAELEEFRAWLRDCCGMDYNTMTFDELKRAALRWFDEQAPQEET